MSAPRFFEIREIRPGARDLLLAELRAHGVTVIPHPPEPGVEDAFRCSAGWGRMAVGFCDLDGTPCVLYATPSLLWPWRWHASADLITQFDRLVERYEPEPPSDQSCD
jgi:hypothetical protein